mgnify:CR=1 FL=1
MALLVSSKPSMEILIPTSGNLSQSSKIRSVKYQLVEITILGVFLYKSSTISPISFLIKVSPPVILVNAILGSFSKVAKSISSSGLVGSLKQSHILQCALHLYVIIIEPCKFVFAIIYAVSFLMC